MTYTILGAQWGNAERTSVIVHSKEVAHVVLSQTDTPDEWAAFIKWSKSNPVTKMAIQEPQRQLTKDERLNKFLSKAGLTLTELKKALKNAGP